MNYAKLGQYNAKAIALLHNRERLKAFYQSLPQAYREQVKLTIQTEAKRRNVGN